MGILRRRKERPEGQKRAGWLVWIQLLFALFQIFFVKGKKK